ncbi:MAG: N-acetylglucosamine-6-phosphate deacetylase [Oscillospiraceae bacterium]|nr:N-acetylglucosamine-6-phosphate deacetylase [Oscillospiraceae bacterium]
MFYKNARIYCSDFRFYLGAFSVKDNRFETVLPDAVPEDAIDLRGATVIPGLIDVHTHGNSGADFSDGDYEGLKKMAAYSAKNGITGFAPTSMTLPYEVLEKAFATGKKLTEEAPAGCARLLGIHMEGPYCSEAKKGSQNGAYLKNPDFEGFRTLYDGCGGLVRIVDVAPELPGAEDFIQKASKLCTVSVAHTDSDYEHAKIAFQLGATHLTHTFNAMPPIHHRNSGVIPAAAENRHVRAELICDGKHIHPSVVRLAFALFGGERMILISDSLRCCGMPKGKYELGGQQILLKDGLARLPDGTVAGSVTNLFDGMVNAIRFGVPETDAIRAATFNPACALGVQADFGSIAPGKVADFIICRSDYTGKRVFLGGREI